MGVVHEPTAVALRLERDPCTWSVNGSMTTREQQNEYAPPPATEKTHRLRSPRRDPRVLPPTRSPLLLMMPSRLSYCDETALLVAGLDPTGWRFHEGVGGGGIRTGRPVLKKQNSSENKVACSALGEGLGGGLITCCLPSSCDD